MITLRLTDKQAYDLQIAVEEFSAARFSPPLDDLDTPYHARIEELITLIERARLISGQSDDQTEEEEEEV
jgi:hypothetical protein